MQSGREGRASILVEWTSRTSLAKWYEVLMPPADGGPKGSSLGNAFPDDDEQGNRAAEERPEHDRCEDQAAEQPGYPFAIHDRRLSRLLGILLHPTISE